MFKTFRLPGRICDILRNMSIGTDVTAAFFNPKKDIETYQNLIYHIGIDTFRG